jgi:hypothetical protein
MSTNENETTGANDETPQAGEGGTQEPEAQPEAVDSAPFEQNGGRVFHRVWPMKGTGNEIPVRFDKARVRIRLAAPSEDAAQAMANMLALTGGDVQAVLDQFNGSAALDVQKTAKGLFKGEDGGKDVTLEQIQALADTHVISRNGRGGGTGGKRQVQAAKAAKLDAVTNAAEAALADLRALFQADAAAAEAQAGLMIRLGLVTEEVVAEMRTSQSIVDAMQPQA